FSSSVLDSAVKAYKAIAVEVERRNNEEETKAETTRTNRTNSKEPGPPITLSDYHTTLLFAAFKRFEFGYFIASFWIGDGGLALYNPNDTMQVKLLGMPDAMEFSGEPSFLTMLDKLRPDIAIDTVFFSFAEDFEALILATDGITNPFFPSEEKIKSDAEWIKFWNVPLKRGSNGNPGCPELFDGSPVDVKGERLLDWLNFWVRGEHDDRTILIVKNHPDHRKIRARSARPGTTSSDRFKPDALESKEIPLPPKPVSLLKSQD
ncbi:MAG: protein phosphatase 2C domain-containing protein, partial [Deltaproteobacteria bacterium]|nr:protein phosphatase 2C domain-containing protein [Deltaproteobacteria bacterium]